MKNRTILSLIGMFSLALLLTVSACKESPTQPVSNSASIVGTWVVMSSNGQDVSAEQNSFTFTQTQGTFKGPEGCTSTYSYTTQGNKVVSTVISDGCSGDPVGTRDTMTYTIVGDQLTFTGNGFTTVMKKGTPNPPPSLTGSWTLKTVDGSTLPTGNSATLTFTNSTFSQTTIYGDGGSCTMTFDLTKTGTRLDIELMQNSCDNDLPIGATDVIMYTITGNTLTLTFSDNTVLVATRN